MLVRFWRPPRMHPRKLVSHVGFNLLHTQRIGSGDPMLLTVMVKVADPL